MPPCVNVRGGSLTCLIVNVRPPLVDAPRHVDERLRHVDDPPVVDAALVLLGLQSRVEIRRAFRSEKC